MNIISLMEPIISSAHIVSLKEFIQNVIYVSTYMNDYHPCQHTSVYVCACVFALSSVMQLHMNTSTSQAPTYKLAMK